MTKVARFSNGHTDEYKGERDVRAAWMIVRKSDGRVLMSGHSLDLPKAHRTAASKLSELGHHVFSSEDPLRYAEGSDWRDTVKAKRAKKEHNEKRLDAIRSLTRTEVVAL